MEASIEICANQCGARCCRAPGHFVCDEDELIELREHADRLGVRFRIIQTGRPDRYIADHGNNGGACAFLDRDTNLCRIYETRPQACRDYPFTAKEPQPECRLWLANHPGE
jgi:Fe-S-cluster containining protein